ncbi:MAG: cation:proton antiporter, partial [Methanomassiliicoccales archaeon]
MNDQEVFALLMLLAVLAQFIAQRFGTTAAIIEIALGVIVANLLGLDPSSFGWLVFMTSLAGVLLTFMAGSEIDREMLKGSWKTSLAIGSASFIAPFVAIFLLCHEVLGWSTDPAFLAAVALSETSIAIVYVVLVEGGKGGTPLGSMLLSACF